MKTFKIYLEEGVNDPAIFKAVFLAGGPGSGKSFMAGKTGLGALGFRIVNSDDAFESAMNKAGLKMDPESIYSDEGQSIRIQAKKLTKAKLDLYIAGRLGLVIDGTGKDYAKIVKQKQKLEALGYETAMIFVNTDEDTALVRNRSRERSLPDNDTSAMWKDVQKNIGGFQAAFGQSNMHVVDNSSETDDKKAKIKVEVETVRAYKNIRKWSTAAPRNGIANRWINSQK